MPDSTIQATVKPRVTPKRKKNGELRGREYLFKSEVEKLIKAAATNPRTGVRDALMIRVAFRHGLRAGELVGLQWDQINLKKASILVKRMKNGETSTQFLDRDEIAGLRKLWSPESSYVFVGQRGPLTVDAFQLIVKTAGVKAKMPFPVHPHMLRHARGYDLANQDGVETLQLQHLLGHKNIQHTVRYTKLASRKVFELSKR